MTFYIILFFVYILISVLYPKSIKYGTIMIIVLFFFSAFRGTMVGTDTSHYIEIKRILFERSREGFNILDYGYVYFVRIIYENNVPERWLIIFLSTVTFLSLFGVAKRTQLLYPGFSLVFLVFFYCLSLNIARQIAAVSILLYGYTFLIDDNTRFPWKFLLFVVLASMLHSTCIIAIICLLFIKPKINKTILIVAAALLFIINAIIPFDFIGKVIGSFTVGNYASRYMDYSGVYRSNIIRIITVAVNLSLLLALFFFKDKNNQKTTMEDNIFFLSIIMTVLSLNMHSDIARVGLIFSIFQVIYLARILIQKEQLSFLVWTLILYNAFLNLFFIAQGTGSLIPYYMEFK